MSSFRKSSHTRRKIHHDQHRFEHWYRDQTVYFITASVRDHLPAFQSTIAKDIFWDRFNHWSQKCGFKPWVTSVLNTHYHTIGYVDVGKNLGTFMQRLHGSIAKLVNDILPDRLRPFFRDRGGRDYFDGCLRDETQYRRAYRYTMSQSVRHGICRDWRSYPHTRIGVGIEEGLSFAKANRGFMEGVRYKRYER